MTMTAEDFGKMAEGLLANAAIQGGSLDTALAFRDIARALADGRLKLVEQKEAQE